MQWCRTVPRRSNDVRQALIECKWRRIGTGLASILLRKVRSCCALTIQYIIYNTVGRSIASIYDRGAHIYRGAIGPPYPIIYNILVQYILVCIIYIYTFTYVAYYII